jgi:hypothetical protein
LLVLVPVVHVAFLPLATAPKDEVQSALPLLAEVRITLLVLVAEVHVALLTLATVSEAEVHVALLVLA